MQSSGAHRILEKNAINWKLQNSEIKWTAEQDALACLTDWGLVGRNIMSQQGFWLKHIPNLN